MTNPDAYQVIKDLIFKEIQDIWLAEYLKQQHS